MPTVRLITPAEVAATLGCTERRVRRLARDHGCCRIIGSRMMFTDEDVTALLEAAKPKPRGLHAIESKWRADAGLSPAGSSLDAARKLLSKMKEDEQRKKRLAKRS